MPDDLNLFDQAKKFISDNRTTLAILAATAITGTVCIAVQRSAIKDWNNFLTAKGLIEEYYNVL